MIPGEIRVAPGEVELNVGRERLTLRVVNTGDRPVQVGSHVHFAQTNPALAFDRGRARGWRHSLIGEAGNLVDRARKHVRAA